MQYEIEKPFVKLFEKKSVQALMPPFQALVTVMPHHTILEAIAVLGTVCRTFFLFVGTDVIFIL